MTQTTAERIVELETEIALLTVAISTILKTGQSYEITTMTGSGTKRVVTMADYQTLTRERDKLRAELASLNCTRSVKIQAGW
jgi:hypothetical protein